MSQSIFYRADIDGLRAIAVLVVVLHHLSDSHIPGGYAGVDVFFVISGFLITSIISKEIIDNRFSFVSFYERRARRLFPALFSMLLLTTIAGFFLQLPSDYVATMRGVLGTLFFSSNIIFWRNSGYFEATDAMLNPLLHTWSLAVEEQFYLIFPGLLLLFSRYSGPRPVFILFVCAVISFFGAVAMMGTRSSAVFFLSPFRAWELLTGALLALNAVPIMKSRAMRELIAFSGLLAIMTVCFTYDKRTPFPGIAALIPVLGTAAIIHAGASGANLVGIILRWGPLRYVGLISYPLYLWHWPVLVLIRYSSDNEIVISLPFLLMVSMALASISYHFIEKPFRQRAIVTRRLVFVSTAIFTFGLSMFAVTALAMNGFVKRFGPEIIKFDEARAPQIPFGECDHRPSGEWCTLGRNDMNATLLLWGDSHMLALAPGLATSLTQQGVRAVFAPTSGCPPLLGIVSKYMPSCTLENLEIKKYLLAHPEIKTVVMAAHWSSSFNNNSPLAELEGDVDKKRSEVAKDSLISTVKWLRENNKYIILIGPIPIFKRSIPLSLALEKKFGHVLESSSASDQRSLHASFYETVRILTTQNDSQYFRFIDPVEWMCADICEIMKEGIPLYRDGNHLSLYGAKALTRNLSAGIFTQVGAANVQGATQHVEH